MNSSQSIIIFKKIIGGPMRMVSIGFTVSAILFYALLGENSLVRWLWIAGLGLFLVTLLVKTQSDAEDFGEESPRFRWYHVLFLFALLVSAFCLRVYRLYDIPLDLSTDIASIGIHAREYLLGAEQNIFGTSWAYFPRLVFLPYALSMSLIGNNLVGFYFATAILGTLNILGIYFFIWRLFDSHRLALLTAVLVAINPVHIEFSRIAGYVDPWFLGYFSLFFFMDGLKGYRKRSFTIAGLFTGFTLVSYPSGRAIIPILGIALVCFWLYKRKWVIENFVGLSWLVLGVLVALGPNLVYMITNWSVYMQRSTEVLIFNPMNIEHLRSSYQVDSVWMIIWEQVKRSVFLFNYHTDNSAQFGYPHPMFNSLISPLIILGFGMGLYRWRKPEFLFVIVSFLFILVTGSILTVNAPTFSRLVGIIPLAAFLIAFCMDQFVKMFERMPLMPFVPFLLFGLALFLGLLAVTDWNIYLREVSSLQTVRPEVGVGRYLATLPKEISACGITDTYLLNQEEINFLGWPRSIVVVSPKTNALTPAICPGKNLVWILSPAYQNRLSELQTQWPSGIVEDHLMYDGNIMFISYLISNQSQ
jgi:hypothetical protein